MLGNPCWIWNELAKRAYHDGCDYYFQLNDDIVFHHNVHTMTWPDQFTAALASNNPPYLGKILDVFGF
jgi:hypothetical protein